MTAADQIRALAAQLAEDMETYERKPFDVPRDGTCDACAQTALLAAAWVTSDGQAELWLCVTCDRFAQDEKSARDALPALADLIDDLDIHQACDCPTDQHGPAECIDCGSQWPCSTAAARDAVLAALGVTQ